MDNRTFDTQLRKYGVKRDRNFQGKGCYEWSLEEARDFRKNLDHDDDETPTTSLKTPVVTDTSKLDFYGLLQQELVASGYSDSDASTASVSFKKMFQSKMLHEMNLEELEALLISSN